MKLIETLKTWFENHNQITSFCFETYRHLQNLQFETDFKIFFI